MEPRFIDLYYEWMEKGELPLLGLCNSVPEPIRKTFWEFAPEVQDFEELDKEGLDQVYWASECRPYVLFQSSDHFVHKVEQSFGALRQTIILFCAAINNEL